MYRFLLFYKIFRAGIYDPVQLNQSPERITVSPAQYHHYISGVERCETSVRLKKVLPQIELAGYSRYFRDNGMVNFIYD